MMCEAIRFAINIEYFIIFLKIKKDSYRHDATRTLDQYESLHLCN